MPKNSNDKARLLCLLKIFERYSDSEHPLSVADIISRLLEQGIAVTRQTLYKDMEELSLWGYEVRAVRGKSYGYYLCNRLFTLPELKLLTDATQSARFIDQQSRKALIDKIASLASTHEALALKRQLYITGSALKRDMARIYRNIDIIYEAISGKRKIRYKYYDLTPDKTLVARHNGAYYEVTPYALVWDDENYYLVAYDEREGEFKHFRVDKLGDVYALESAALDLQGLNAPDLSKYAEQLFGMYNGESTLVRLVCHNSLAGVIADKFGQEVTFFKQDSEHFFVNVRVKISPNFFSWLMMFSDRIKIDSPEETKKQYKELLLKTAKIYE